MTPPLVPDPPLPALPDGWAARVPGAEDVAAVVALVGAHRAAVRGDAAGDVDADAVASRLTGTGSWTRRQVVLDAPHGGIGAWAWVHDRAAGRTDVDLVVGPDVPEADAVAAALLSWVARAGREVAAARDLPATQLDASAYDTDERQRRWLAAAGYRCTRTWLHMTRPVDDAAGLPGPRPGVRVRPVATHADGSPVGAELQVVHRMLEESFADHFNSYRETFQEFVQRLREDPGHRWDHWWVAEVEIEGVHLPGGALVGSVSPPDASGTEGSYVDYIGVHRRARGRGVAKALLHTILRDAHDRGRNRVGLEVDADSPTGADGLYVAMGWVTDHRTESWHADVGPGMAGGTDG